MHDNSGIVNAAIVIATGLDLVNPTLMEDTLKS